MNREAACKSLQAASICFYIFVLVHFHFKLLPALKLIWIKNLPFSIYYKMIQIRISPIEINHNIL